MHALRTPFPLFLLALGAGAPAASALPQAKGAPEHPAPSAPSSSVMRSAHGTALVDGELWGAGPDYKILFRDGGFELTPALGRAAPRNFPLSFELESIARGGAVVLAGGAPAAPELGADGLVRYAHPFDIEERYETRADGVEQSFLFGEPVPGSGDLVVRGRLAGELAAPLGEHAELAFGLPDLGGVRFGAVTGIDAAGRTAAGSLRYDGSALELVLPGEFVDAASYPLVLDPLIGSWFVIPGIGTFDESDPDVAFDAGNNLYLVAWHREYSSSDFDIHAQRVSTTGTPIGSLLMIENAAGTFAINPTVAQVAATRRFLVAWQHKTTGDYDILARAVDASDGDLSVTITLGSSVLDELDPDAGGERTTADDDVLVVWERQDTGIFGAQVSLPSGGGNPFIVTQPLLVADTRAYRPAIAKSGGGSGRALLAYNVLYEPGDVDVHVALVDRNGVLLEGPTGLVTSTDSEYDPDVDGDGTNWLVGYLFDTASTDSEVWCKRVIYSPLSSSLLFGTQAALTSDGVGQYNPAVGWTPGKAFVAWQQAYDLFDYDIYARGVDPSDCGTCEPTMTLDYSDTWDGEPELASQYSGGSSGDQVFATWYSGLGSLFSISQTDIKGQRLEAFGGGSSFNLGGHCGGGGTIGTSGAIAAGNPSFTVTLSGADVSATTGLLVVKGTSIPAYTCGTCTVMLTASQYSVPMSAGACSQTVPLPCDTAMVGGQLDAQWVVLPTASVPCPIFGNIGVSDRLRLTIGQ